MMDATDIATLTSLGTIGAYLVLRLEGIARRTRHTELFLARQFPTTYPIEG